MKKRRKNRLFLTILIFVISLISFLLALFFSMGIVLEKKEIYTSLNVSGIAGLDLNTTMLTFGDIIPGSSVTRNLQIENKYNFPIVVKLKAEGNISKFLSFEKQILVKPNETKLMRINAIIPKNAEYTSYSGKIIALIKKSAS